MIGINPRILKHFVLSCALLIIAPAELSAETQESLQLPPIERKALLNGMQVLFLDGDFEKIPFVLLIKNGAAFDPVDKWGATNLMGRMIVASLGDEQTQREFAEKNIALDCLVTWDAIYFIGNSPIAELDFALSRLSDAVVRPQFTEESFEQEKSAVRAELESAESGLDHSTEKVFQERVFGNSPYGKPVEGTPESLDQIYLRDVKIQYRRLMIPNQAQLAVYAPAEREELFRRQSRRWGSWVRNNAAPFTFRKSLLPDSPRLILLDSQEGEGYLKWGYLGVSKKSQDYVTLKILEQYLTLSMPDWAQAVSESSQIRGRVRHIARRMPGYLQVSIHCSEDELLPYFESLSSSLEQLRSGQLDLQRFEESKEIVFQDFAAAMNDPLGRLREILETDLFNLGISYVSTFNLRLDRTTPEAFQRRLRAVLPPEKFTLILGGPVEKLKAEFEKLGEVEVLN